MTTTKIVNAFGSSISSEQALITLDYTIQTFYNGELKKLEDYHANAFFNGTYFMDDTENLQDVLNDTVTKSGKAWSILTDKQTLNSYSMWDVNAYSGDGKLAWQAIQVFNGNNWTIMSAPLESLLKFETSLKAEKYYFGEQATNEVLDCLLVFDYNSKGTISAIYDINDNWGCQWRGLSMDEFLNSPIARDFSFDEHPYYKSLQPYLPTTETL